MYIYLFHCLFIKRYTEHIINGNIDAEHMVRISGRAGGWVGCIAARGQIYMGAPIGVVEIHLRAKLPHMSRSPTGQPPLPPPQKTHKLDEVNTDDDNYCVTVLTH